MAAGLYQCVYLWLSDSRSVINMAISNLQSPLLRLPRELRDIVYSYILVSGTISIEAAITRVPRSRIAVGGEIGFCEALYQQYRLTSPLMYRATWTIPVEESGIPEEDSQLDSSVVHITVSDFVYRLVMFQMLFHLCYSDPRAGLTCVR